MNRLLAFGALALVTCAFTGCEDKPDTKREIKIETPRSSTTIKTEIEKKDSEP